MLPKLQAIFVNKDIHYRISNAIKFVKKIVTLLSDRGIRYRTPTILQMEATECGAAALGIILSYYGRVVPLAQLRQDCGVSRDGSKAPSILKAARAYGMNARGFTATLGGLRHLQCPYIVFWNFNHFLVVEGFSNKQVYLNDPATGPRSVSLKEFDESFTGIVLVLNPGPQFQKGGSKLNISLALWKRLQGFIQVLAYCICAGFLLAISGLVSPLFSQMFVDHILVQNRQEWLRPLLILMILIAILNGLLTLLQLKFLRRMKIKLSASMSTEFFLHILCLPVSFYAQRFAGEISSRIHLNDELAALLSGKLATTAIASVMSTFYVIIMLQYDAVLTLIGIVFVAINLLTLQKISRWRVDVNIKLLQEKGKVNGVAIAGLQSMETLKASGLESDFFARWAGYYAKSINAHQEIHLTNQVLGILPSFLSTITSMLVLAFGGLRVIDGNLSIGMLVAFGGLMQSFMEPVNNLVSFGSDIQEVEGILNRLDDVLQNPVILQLREEPHRAGERVFDSSLQPQSDSDLSPKLQGYVKLENVTFGFNRVDAPLIENFNLSIKPGQRIALIGESGSGKSTLAKIICGLYEPTQGEIKFDGKPRNQIPRQVIVNSIALVEQDILIFAGSVRDNLTLWDTTVPESSLVQACQDAAIHDVILSLPGGYDSKLSEGATNLSGGQRQRLEIARALVNNPSILILDEATRSLDAQTEKIIDQNLRQRGCTCIIVAHRLSTIRDCDEIIVLERGLVVQRGTHEQLHQVEGPYLQLICGEGDTL